MGVWTHFVDLIFTTLVGLSTMLGGNMGLAIGVLSLSVRLALLPLTLRLAQRSLEVQAALKKLEPQLAGIRKKYRGDPERVWQETASLHQEHGIRIVDAKGFISILVQVPLFLGLFAAVQRGLSSKGRFLWVRDLMQADPWLAGICAVLTGVSAVLVSNAPESQRTAWIVVPALLTLLFLWKISAGVAIYSLSQGLVGVAQSLLLRRHARKLNPGR
jgi:YidC/Oxa1 family membrane protein insertase